VIVYERTHNLELVRLVVTHQKIWPWVGDETFDYESSAYWPNDDPRIWYVTAAAPGRLIGLFTLLPENSVCWQLHVALLPEHWGQRLTHDAEREFAAWVWENTPCKRIVGSVPAYNPHARRCVERMGLRPFGVNEKSIRKFGRIWDCTMVGISRPE
jgi:RimJ/RimL family protein N-acetyltransferase